MEIRCHPPKGNPVPNIYWLKNDMLINEEKDKNFIVTSEGHLIIIEARMRDSGNYTCIAENVAAKRRSPSAEINIQGKYTFIIFMNISQIFIIHTIFEIFSF